MPEGESVSDRLLRHAFRNVSVKRETICKLLDRIDANEDGRISLAEVVAALKALWRAAMGKEKRSKRMRTAD